MDDLMHGVDLSNVRPPPNLPMGSLGPKLPPNFPHLQQFPPMAPEGYEFLPQDPYLAAMSAAAGRLTPSFVSNDMMFEVPPQPFVGMQGFFPGNFKFQRYAFVLSEVQL